MPRGKELSPHMRTRICEAKACGLTYKQIHIRHPEVSIATAKYTVRKEL
jgi:hypothetical protein